MGLGSHGAGSSPAQPCRGGSDPGLHSRQDRTGARQRASCGCEVPCKCRWKRQQASRPANLGRPQQALAEPLLTRPISSGFRERPLAAWETAASQADGRWSGHFITRFQRVQRLVLESPEPSSRDRPAAKVLRKSVLLLSLKITKHGGASQAGIVYPHHFRMRCGIHRTVAGPQA